MSKFDVEVIESGSSFTEDVFIDNKYIILPPKTKITELLLSKLKKWGYDHIVSSGNISKSTALNKTKEKAKSLVEKKDLLIEEGTDAEEKAEIETCIKYYYDYLDFSVEF